MDETRAVPHAGEHHPEVHHETSDVNVRAILWFAASFILVAVVIHVGLYFLFDVFVERENRRARMPVSLVARKKPLIPPEPRLQPFPEEPARWVGAQQRTIFNTPAEDMQELRAREDAMLNHYGWVDQSKGVVRIPIERAMELLVLRGVPASQPVAPLAPPPGGGQ